MKRYKDYLNGTSGRESELAEDKVSSDGIAPVLGSSMSDLQDVSCVRGILCGVLPNVEGAEDGPVSVF